MSFSYGSVQAICSVKTLEIQPYTVRLKLSLNLSAKENPECVIVEVQNENLSLFQTLSLISILISFPGCKPEQQMMYAGSKNKLVQTAELTKVVFVFDWLVEIIFSLIIRVLAKVS